MLASTYRPTLFFLYVCNPRRIQFVEAEIKQFWPNSARQTRTIPFGKSLRTRISNLADQFAISHSHNKANRTKPNVRFQTNSNTVLADGIGLVKKSLCSALMGFAERLSVRMSAYCFELTGIGVSCELCAVYTTQINNNIKYT